MTNLRDVVIFLTPALAGGFFAVMAFLLVDWLNERLHLFYNSDHRQYRKPVEKKAAAA